MENIATIAQLIKQGLDTSATATKAVLQAIQLGYSLAEMDNQTKKAG